MKLLKDDIVNYVENYLIDPVDNNLTNKLIEKGNSLITHFSKIKISDLKNLIKKDEKYSNIYYQGWHSLHYAALNEDFNVFKYIFEISIKNKLSNLPITSKNKKNVSINTSFKSFCIQHDKDKIFAYILSKISNPEIYNYESLLYKCLFHKAPNCTKFLSGLIKKQSQDIIFNYYNEVYIKSEDNDDLTIIYEHQHGAKYRADFFIRNALKYNIKNIENFGIDIQYRDENNNNYFISTLNAISNNKQYYEQKDIFYKNTLNYFLNKKFELDEFNNNGVSPRILLNDILNTVGFMIAIELKQIISSYDKSRLELSLSIKKDETEIKFKI